MIAILDYDAGNTHSVENALIHLGASVELTRDISVIRKASGVILPGVGAFGDAMERLKEYNLISPIKEIVDAKKPFLGICLGLQLLFEQSEESPGVQGLGILPGSIVRFPDKPLKVPHIGWNSLSFSKNSPLFEGIEEESFVYFVHSYYLKAQDPSIVTARSEYGVSFDASVQSENVFACQFHPEKSGRIGLKMLSNFLRLCEEED